MLVTPLCAKAPLTAYSVGNPGFVVNPSLVCPAVIDDGTPGGTGRRGERPEHGTDGVSYPFMRRPLTDLITRTSDRFSANSAHTQPFSSIDHDGDPGVEVWKYR